VGFTDGPLFLYNLSLADKRGLLIPKVYLIVQAVRLVDDRLDDGLYDFAAVHGDADVVADFVGYGRCANLLFSKEKTGGDHHTRLPRFLAEIPPSKGPNHNQANVWFVSRWLFRRLSKDYERFLRSTCGAIHHWVY
jgi:hypothetical protein